MDKITITDPNDPNATKYELWSRGRVSQPFRYYDHVLIDSSDEETKKHYRTFNFGKCMTTSDAVKKYDGISLHVATIKDRLR